jgi:predicted HTH transcriptional regulator
MNGTFIRISGTTRKADEFIIKELVFQGEYKSFDQTVPFDQYVTKAQIDTLCNTMYEYALSHCINAAEKLAVKKVEQKNLIAWGLIVQKKDLLLPTYGFQLLTNNPLPEASIQCAIFKGKDRTVFLDRKEYHGPLYEEIDDAYAFILRNIRMGAEIDGVYRKDVYELPLESVREILANGVCHRSYLDPSKMQVALFDDRLEITSPGMLIGGLTIEDLKNGCSKPRNRALVTAFTYMKIIEQWGSGIPRVFKACKEAGLAEPELSEIGGSFKVKIFRKQQATPQATPQATIEFLLSYCSIPRTRKEMIKAMNLNDRKSFKKTYIDPLLASGKLRMTLPEKPRSPLQRYVATDK